MKGGSIGSRLFLRSYDGLAKRGPLLACEIFALTCVPDFDGAGIVRWICNHVRALAVRNMNMQTNAVLLAGVISI